MGKNSIRGALPAKAPGQSTELMLRLRLRRSACLPEVSSEDSRRVGEVSSEVSSEDRQTERQTD